MEADTCTDLKESKNKSSAGSSFNWQMLIDACRQNDRKAQAEVYQRLHGKMLALCLRYFVNRDDALSVMNHGFLKVFTSLSGFDHSYDFEGWVYRIIQRTAIDEVRKQVRRSKHEMTEEELPDDSMDPDIVRNMDAQDIMRLLHQLPKATNAVFNLYAIEGYTHPEIAEMLDISVGTSKWHLHSARQQLKTLIERINRQ
ncbi:MAG: sigma-70 family RNA polymerase sigma factor [Bacteroidetes bacterium]|nr:sigma-70 family RNA polymerase sigma factor [Bacteroidota bacterium]